MPLEIRQVIVDKPSGEKIAQLPRQLSLQKGEDFILTLGMSVHSLYAWVKRYSKPVERKRLANTPS